MVQADGGATLFEGPAQVQGQFARVLLAPLPPGRYLVRASAEQEDVAASGAFAFLVE